MIDEINVSSSLWHTVLLALLVTGGWIVVTYSYNHIFLSQEYQVESSLLGIDAADNLELPSPPVAVANRAATTVKICTHNLWCHYPMSFVPWKQCPTAIYSFYFQERMTEFVRYIQANEYDVVCVQEVFMMKMFHIPAELGISNLQYLSNLMKVNGFKYWTDGSHDCKNTIIQTCFHQNSGLCVFSKYKLCNIKHISFTQTGEAINNKGFISCEIHFPGESDTIRFINTHFDSRDLRSKKCQIEQIVHHIEEHPIENSTTIICGDLNICPQRIYDNGEQYSFLKKQMNAIGLQDLWNETESIPTENSGGSLDHIFLDKKESWFVEEKLILSIRNRDQLNISDHLGISVTLRK